jgi:hypothetical protein
MADSDHTNILDFKNICIALQSALISFDVGAIKAAAILFYY